MISKSITEITESIDNSNGDSKIDERIIDNDADGNNVVSTNINGNSTNKNSKENQSCDSSRASIQDQTNQSCDSSRASIQDQTKQQQSPIKLGNNRPNATAWKVDTPEQTKKVIILSDSIVNYVRGNDLSHSLESEL